MRNAGEQSVAAHGPHHRGVVIVVGIGIGVLIASSGSGGSSDAKVQAAATRGNLAQTVEAPFTLALMSTASRP